ncbi:ribulose-phosphate 3-epimerase [Lachnospiraceae bacterium OttesenSCG-928-E19]|nr:ribulose-phosphate 3-epimerase [Lachnospiraceae bacterium OttesenSCG-928-E19]
MKNILAPSILAADFTKLGEQIVATQEGGAEYLHFDVMDGAFVPSISFGMPVLQSIKDASNQFYDVHLMIQEPIRYIEEFAKAGADSITIHLEACENVEETIQAIRNQNIKVGISICPDTPISALEPWVSKVDMILIMSVHPGFGGQKFIESSLDKIRNLRKLLNEKNLSVDIQVDGGIYLTNVETVLEAGANVIVAGSAVFHNDPKENVKAFMEILKKND